MVAEQTDVHPVKLPGWKWIMLDGGAFQVSAPEIQSCFF